MWRRLAKQGLFCLAQFKERRRICAGCRVLPGLALLAASLRKTTCAVSALSSLSGGQAYLLHSQELGPAYQVNFLVAGDISVVVEQLTYAGPS
jgi:hypothetical protein